MVSYYGFAVLDNIFHVYNTTALISLASQPLADLMHEKWTIS